MIDFPRSPAPWPPVDVGLEDNGLDDNPLTAEELSELLRRYEEAQKAPSKELPDVGEF